VEYQHAHDRSGSTEHQPVLPLAWRSSTAGGYSTPATVKTIKDGLKNFLRTFGVLEGSPVTREEQCLPLAFIVDGRDPKGFVEATRAGIYENCVALGSDVLVGDVVGRIHDFDYPDVEPKDVCAKIPGVVYLIRGFPPVTTGDVVCVVGKKFNSLEEMENADMQP
jgi:N-alpha-acetyl-L-2,4-diaminobutyrate deacetylase